MSGDPNELTEQEAQIHEEWRGEEMDSTAEPRTLAIELPEDHPAAGHHRISLPKAEAFARGEFFDRFAESAIGRPHEQQAATDVLPVSLTHTADQPRTLRQILFTHRALAAAKALEITELMAELEPLFRRPDPSGVTADVLADARRQRDNARGQDQLFGKAFRIEDGAGHYEAAWINANPGLVALLQAVDGA